MITSADQLANLSHLYYKDVYIQGLDSQTDLPLFRSCYHSILRISDSNLQTILSDDNHDCSVILNNSRVGKVAENESLRLTLYTENSVFTDRIAFLADRIKINATNCQFHHELINQLHQSDGLLFFTNCSFLQPDTVFDTIFSA